MRGRALVVALGAVLLIACARRTVGAPPAAPARLTTLADAVPADLDLVIRVDIRRIRDALGETVWADLRKGAASSARSTGDAATEQFLAEALGRADLAYIGVRPSPSEDALDNVVALSGNFSGLDPRRTVTAPLWRPAIDLGANWRRYDRSPPRQRPAPARIYLYGDEQLVCVSEAEIDSVERVLELGKRDASLKVPAQGVIALAARLPPILPRLLEGAPTFAELVAGARELEASADVTTTGLRIAAAVKFQSGGAAKRFGEAASGLTQRLGERPGVVGKIAQAARFETLGSDVTIRAYVDRQAFGEIVACAAGPGCL